MVHAGPVRERRDVQRHLHLPGYLQRPCPGQRLGQPERRAPRQQRGQFRRPRRPGKIVDRSPRAGPGGSRSISWSMPCAAACTTSRGTTPGSTRKPRSANSSTCPRLSMKTNVGQPQRGERMVFRIRGPAVPVSGSNTNTRTKLHDREWFTTPYGSKPFVIMENIQIPDRRTRRQHLTTGTNP